MQKKNILLFGYDKLRKLIKEPDNFVEAFGITKDELQDKWNAYIKSNESHKN